MTRTPTMCERILDRVWPFSVIRAQQAALQSHTDRDQALQSDLRFLRSRDALCSNLANQVNRLKFELAKAKGEYE